MNRKRYNALLLSLTIFLLCPLIASAETAQEVPNYAKWGKIALTQVLDKYPNSQAVEYSYQGREEISGTKTRDTFEFLIKSDDKKLPVQVEVTHNPKTDKLISVHFRELS